MRAADLEGVVGGATYQVAQVENRVAARAHEERKVRPVHDQPNVTARVHGVGEEGHPTV